VENVGRDRQGGGATEIFYRAELTVKGRRGKVGEREVESCEKGSYAKFYVLT